MWRCGLVVWRFIVDRDRDRDVLLEASKVFIHCVESFFFPRTPTQFSAASRPPPSFITLSKRPVYNKLPSLFERADVRRP